MKSSPGWRQQPGLLERTKTATEILAKETFFQQCLKPDHLLCFWLKLSFQFSRRVSSREHVLSLGSGILKYLLVEALWPRRSATALSHLPNPLRDHNGATDHDSLSRSGNGKTIGKSFFWEQQKENSILQGWPDSTATQEWEFEGK